MTDKNEADVIEVDLDALPLTGPELAGKEDADLSVQAPEPKAEVVEKPEVDDGIEQFKSKIAQLERDKADEAAARRAAEEQVARHQQEAARYQANGIDGEINTLKSGRETALANISMLKKQIAEASRDGDHEKVADITDKLSEFRVYVAQIDHGLRQKTWEKEQRQHQAQTQQQRPEQKAPPTWEDGVRAMPDSPSKDWLMRHQNELKDENRRRSMMAGHYDAEANGIKVDSPEYFDHVERFMGLKDQPAAEPRRQQVAAPPSRNAPTPGRGEKLKFTPTAQHRQAAADMDMTMDEYAKYWAIGVRQNLINTGSR